MIKELNLHNPDIVRQLFKLQRASYFIEAQLINYYDIPPLKETEEELINSKETFIGYFEGDNLAGAISYSIQNGELTICRMVVHPDYFRKGIAQNLLTKMEELNQNVTLFSVSTGKDNAPAKNFYLKNHYQFVSDTKVGSGLLISHFKKEKHHPA